MFHKALSCLESQLAEEGDTYTVSMAKDVLVHTDGWVHPHTFTRKYEGRRQVTSENIAVADLGVVIYDALDYSLPQDEQRTLSAELEDLIDKMVSADEEEEDEGIGEEVDIKKTGLCADILELCRLHLAVKREADSHYKSVCRSDTLFCIDGSIFLDHDHVYVFLTTLVNIEIKLGD